MPFDISSARIRMARDLEEASFPVDGLDIEILQFEAELADEADPHYQWLKGYPSPSEMRFAQILQQARQRGVRLRDFVTPGRRENTRK